MQSRIQARLRKSTSIWISKRLAVVGVAALVLTGCESLPVMSFAPPDVSRPEAEARVAAKEIMLTGGVRVRAPSGKCVDTERVRQSAEAATVVMANCSNLGGREDVGASNPGIIFVTLVPGSHGAISDLAAQLRSDPGLLARSGRAADVEVISVKASSVAVYANVDDKSGGGPDGVSSLHWKAALNVADRAAIISVFGGEGSPLPNGAGEALARDVAQALLDGNAT